MGETEVVQRTEVPATVESLQADLRALGLRPGMVVLVHSSLRAPWDGCAEDQWQSSLPSRKSWAPLERW